MNTINKIWIYNIGTPCWIPRNGSAVKQISAELEMFYICSFLWIWTSVLQDTQTGCLEPRRVPGLANLMNSECLSGL